MHHACKSNNDSSIVVLETNMGNIKIKLYDETPLHRDNFKKLVTDDFFDGVLFHRVIKNFMIQTGDPESKNASKGATIGTGGPGYTIPAEIVPNLMHKKGALAAARQGDDINPKRASSGSQFYIVQGIVYTTKQLDKLEKSKRNQMLNDFFSRPENAEVATQITTLNNDSSKTKEFNNLIEKIEKKLIAEKGDFKLTEKQKQIYTTVGGTPHLDNQYTVFGEVIEGLDVVDKIAAVKTRTGDRPVEDIIIENMYVE